MGWVETLRSGKVPKLMNKEEVKDDEFRRDHSLWYK